MQAGIGHGNHADALVLGQQIAAQALAHGNIETPGLVLAFCHGQLDATAFYHGLRTTVGNTVPILGGSAIGIITNNDLSYTGFPAGAAILQLDDTQLRIAAASHIDQDEYRAGSQMGASLATDPAGHLALIFYDSVKVPPTPDTPPLMNASPPLIAGIESALPAAIPIVGAGVLGDYTFSPTYQFCGSYVGQQSVVGALFGGNIVPYMQIMHGCTLKDGIYHTITCIDGPVIYEIDGQPAVELIDAL